MKFSLKKCALATACIAVLGLCACGNGNETAQPVSSNEMPKVNDANIDLEGLNNSAEAIKNLDLDTDVSISGSKTDEAESSDTSDLKKDDTAAEPEGEKTIYSYTDVYRAGNDLTVIPNGGIDGSTVLYGGKDIDGFLDYVDSEVLESGRSIDRELFCDVLAIMLVDKALSPDIGSIEKNMIMALAMANNFYDADVNIKECYLDANNAADYHYKLTAYGKDDTWTVNYGKRTIYMNDGATEYSSDMFKDENLAVWMIAIEEYYNIK